MSNHAMTEQPNMTEVFGRLATGDERARDLAAEQLGDLLQSPGGATASQIQSISDALVSALTSERSPLVTESILNALAHATELAAPPLIQAEPIRERYASLTGSALEHAKYILEGAQ